MRHSKIIILLLALAAMTGCVRRPFTELKTKVYIAINVNVNVEHEFEPLERPDLMKVVLYDRNTGKPMYIDYISSEGGYIYPEPGDYDIMVYNYNTIATSLHGEDNKLTLSATTSEIPEYIKAQKRPFFAARMKAREEALRRQQEAEGLTPETKQDTKAPEEKIVYEPDHLFVGRKENVQIPTLEYGQILNIEVQIEAHTIVDTWHVKFTNVDGTRFVSDISALMSGLIESTMLWTEEDYDGPVALFFDMAVGKEKNTLFGTFHTFGRHPEQIKNLNVDIGVMNLTGQSEYYHFDVSDQFTEENLEHMILIEQHIKIKEPEKGSGFLPSVEDWEDVETDIII